MFGLVARKNMKLRAMTSRFKSELCAVIIERNLLKIRRDR